jgi:hypothetical protein
MERVTGGARPTRLSNSFIKHSAKQAELHLTQLIVMPSGRPAPASVNERLEHALENLIGAKMSSSTLKAAIHLIRHAIPGPTVA